MKNPVIVPDETLCDAASELEEWAQRYEEDGIPEAAQRIRRLVMIVDHCRSESRKRRKAILGSSIGIALGRGYSSAPPTTPGT
jgi:hypothetical protein